MINKATPASIRPRVASAMSATFSKLLAMFSAARFSRIFLVAAEEEVATEFAKERISVVMLFSS